MSKEIDNPYFSAIAHILLSRYSYVSKSIPAGVTYLGQFVSHDIVPATSKGRQAREVTPYLNLDSVYGEGNVYLSNDGTFPIRPVKDKSGVVIGYDVPRERTDKGFVAKIAEPRNDDVLIVTQLHVFFQRLHNAILASGYVFDYVEAKQCTTLIFQLLVIEEFSKTILNKRIFEDYFAHGKSYYNLWDKSRIPSFFSKAAFRFGHSLVRPDYILNEDPVPVRLSEIFTTNQKLTDNLVIDWAKFFDSEESQEAMKIDGKFASSLRSVQALDKSFNAINLVEKNLIAGFHAGLPLGMEVVNSISDLLPTDLDSGEFWYEGFSDTDFAKRLAAKEVTTSIKKLPLWPFILLEAEVAEQGERLGQIGSILTAEVITNAIAGAQDSVFKNGRYDLRSTLEEMGALGQLLTPGMTSGFGFMKVFDAMISMEER